MSKAKYDKWLKEHEDVTEQEKATVRKLYGVEDNGRTGKEAAGKKAQGNSKSK